MTTENTIKHPTLLGFCPPGNGGTEGGKKTIELGGAPFGFVKVGSAIPSVRVADVRYNLEQIELQIVEAVKQGVEILCFPELAITGYTCQDLFMQTALLDASDKALEELGTFVAQQPIIVIVGAPVRQGNRLFNSAVVMSGTEKFVVNKTYLPNYHEFYEQRWFAGEEVGRDSQVFELPSGVKFSVEICEDLWSPIPPSSFHALAGADIIFNLSATDELLHKNNFLKRMLKQQSSRTISGYVYTSCGFGESTQDVVYSGNALIYEHDECLASSRRFSIEPQLITAQIDVERLRSMRLQNSSFRKSQESFGNAELIPLEPLEPLGSFELQRIYNPHPMWPAFEGMDEGCEEIFNIQVMGLMKRLQHTHCKNVVIGISGGLDSTLALLVSVRAFDRLGLDRKGVHGITMPGYGTTDRTHANAVQLMTQLGISQREINIVPGVEQHFHDIGHDKQNHNITYENSQARYRTMLLMDIANQVGGMVIGTGDLSELALGWCTYNGDHMSMYAVNVGVAKTLVQYVIKYVANHSSDDATKATLLDIVDTPISPELIPADDKGNIVQKTEDLVGPYELHDFFLFHFLKYGFSREKIRLIAHHTFCEGENPEYDQPTVDKWLDNFFRRFFQQQFKRSCLPDGPKVADLSLSPRGDWRMPSDACQY